MCVCVTSLGKPRALSSPRLTATKFNSNDQLSSSQSMLDFLSVLVPSNASTHSTYSNCSSSERTSHFNNWSEIYSESVGSNGVSKYRENQKAYAVNSSEHCQVSLQTQRSHYNVEPPPDQRLCDDWQEWDAETSHGGSFRHPGSDIHPYIPTSQVGTLHRGSPNTSSDPTSMEPGASCCRFQGVAMAHIEGDKGRPEFVSSLGKPSARFAPSRGSPADTPPHRDPTSMEPDDNSCRLHGASAADTENAIGRPEVVTSLGKPSEVFAPRLTAAKSNSNDQLSSSHFRSEVHLCSDEFSESTYSTCSNCLSSTGTNDCDMSSGDSYSESVGSYGASKYRENQKAYAANSSEHCQVSAQTQTSHCNTEPLPDPRFCDTWQEWDEVTSHGGSFTHPGSDIRLHIPAQAVEEGASVTVSKAVCTDLDLVHREFHLPQEEFIMSPVVEYHAGQNFRFQKPVLLALPHFLPPTFSQNKVKVYRCYRSESGQWTVETVQQHQKDNLQSARQNLDHIGSFCFAENKEIHISTTHFSIYFCTDCGKEYPPPDLYMEVYAKYEVKQSGEKTASIRLYICDSRILIGDFKKVGNSIIER